MHDPPDSRARCFFLVQCVRTAQSRGALLGAMARLGQSRQLLVWAHRQYLRLGARPLGVGFGCGWRLLPSCPRTGTSASGTILATAPSPKAHPRSHPIRSSPVHSRKSPHQIRLALPRAGRTHRVSHHHVPGHSQVLTEAHSPKDLLFAGRNISGLTINLTLIPVRDALTLFVPAAFWLSLQPQPSGCRDGKKKRRSCRDTPAVPPSDNGPEDTSLDAVTQVELVQGEVPARSCLGFF